MLTVANWDWQASNEGWSWIPKQRGQGFSQFLASSTSCLYVPFQPSLPPLGESLTFTDKTQALRSCLVEWLWWGRASGRASRRRRPRPGKQGGTNQALLSDWAKTQPGRAGDRGVSNKGGVSQVLTLVVSVQLPSTATILTTSRSLPPLGKKTGTSLYKSLIFFLSWFSLQSSTIQVGACSTREKSN